jgi:hypothetical protein
MSETENEWSLMNQRYAIQCLKMMSRRGKLAIVYSKGRKNSSHITKNNS